MARWRSLTDHLATADDTCRLTWEQLSALVGSLPPSASNHRAWWSGDRPQVRAWQAAGFRLAHVTLGQEVTFIREHPSGTCLPAADILNARDAASSFGGNARQHGAALDPVLLLACSKRKLEQPAPARDLYTSPLFRTAREHAERKGGPWFILSAEHGLVAPDEWLAPYDRYLRDTPPGYRGAWGHWVVERLDLLVGGLANRTVEIHAGSAYVDPIVEPLSAKGCRISLPLSGLAVGERQHWYTAEPDTSAASWPEEKANAGNSSSDPGDPAFFAALLLDEQRAVSPDAFLQHGSTGLKAPGLYSWWADQQAAADLSEGLGHTVEPGLIYAGLAGATGWPSGKRSTNTLWSRIAGMHLGKRHEFSTFRRTLGAVQAQRSGTVTVDEESLTEWMKAHLRVIAAPYEDADALGRLETDVLRLLDPPLNLQGMPPTPLRGRLTELRRQITGQPSPE
jgi:hypothetical protein